MDALLRQPLPARPLMTSPAGATGLSTEVSSAV
jgi:hypothetical protein